MIAQQWMLSAADGMQLPCVLWLPEGQVRGIVQVTHGMTEHIGRFEPLAQVLTDNGFAAAGYDLRGHGKNSGSSTCASFGQGGWEASLEDMRLLHALLLEKFPSVPHFMLGFSLGSFLLREYLAQHTEGISGAIIMGTGYQPAAVLSLMMAIVKSQCKKCGFDGTTPLVHQLSFGVYNQKFKPNRTQSDWLCADEAQLDAYLNDPLCRKEISAGLFHQLLSSMKRTGSKHAYDTWNKQLPVLLLSGKDDPVGDAGKGVESVCSAMKKAGLTQISLHLFDGARHDLLHEEAGAANEARKVLLNWLFENL